MVRVLFVSAVSDLRGGAEKVLQDMLANPQIEPVLALPAPGPLIAVAAEHDCPVVYFEPDFLLSIRRPLTLISALRSIPDSLRCAGRLRRMAREHRCEIVHSNGLKVHFLNVLATAFRRGLRSVVHLHDIPYTATERLLWRVLGMGANRVVVVSRPCWPDRHLPPNVHIIPNGVVERTYVNTPAAPEATRSGVFRLGFVGRFHPHKGLMLLVDWLAAARDAGLSFEVRLRGGPDPDRPAYWAAVQRRLQEQGLQDRVHMDGWLSGDAIYSELDALVVPSDCPDPLPRVVLEAGSCGLPVIALPTGGIPSMIVDRKTGFLVSDSSQFVAVLADLIGSPAVCHSIGVAAREHIAAEFTLRRFYERFDALYAGLAGGRQRLAPQRTVA